MTVFTKFYSDLRDILISQSKTLSSQTTSSSILGNDRELFIKTVLEKSLPSNIIVDSGVIIDSEHSESNPQDIILYRSDFPVLASHVGSRLFLAEGVASCIEVKSNLDAEEFERANKTLKSAHGMKNFGSSYPIDIDDKDKARFDIAMATCPYTLNQMTTQRYIFAYKGVTRETLASYLDKLLSEDYSFFHFPSVICILDRGICLIKDDGQLTPPSPPKGKNHCLYLAMNEPDRALEFLMMHILSSCLMTISGLIYPGTPLSFNIFDYMKRDARADRLRVESNADISAYKIKWKDNKHVNTYDHLKELGFLG